METATVQARPRPRRGRAIGDGRRPASEGRRENTGTHGRHVQGRVRQLGRPQLHRGRRDRPRLALGLIDLGIERGDKVAILAQHPARMDLLRLRGADRSAPPSSRSTRRTRPRSASTCWRTPTLWRSSSRTSEQLEKIRAVRDQLPEARAHDPDDRRGRRRDLARGAGRPRRRARDVRVGGALRARSASDDICTFIYTSGTTGPPKGCVISHGNYRSMLDMVARRERRSPARTTSPTSSSPWPTRSRC